MTLLVVGTYPLDGGPLVEGDVALDAERKLVTVNAQPLANAQGASALLGAACAASAASGACAPYALLGGDIGRGDGTRAVFAQLPETIKKLNPDVIVFHYMQPIMALMRRALKVLSAHAPQARLVADAGGMYAAKAAGCASSFELMTPDVGEIGFLAQSGVSHPAYVSHFLFGNQDFDPPSLARQAHETNGAARVLLIKGAVDTIAVEGEVVARVEEPSIPLLEAIGGTGDTLTGLCAGLMSGGIETTRAAHVAAHVNREAGIGRGLTPAHHAIDLVVGFPEVLERVIARDQQP